MVAGPLILVARENIGRLFPALPASLVDTSKAGLLLMGLTLALGMPVEAIAGTFTGIQRNELVAVIQGGSKLVLAVALITIVVVRGGVTSMAAAFAMANVAGYLAYWWTSRRLDVVDISYRPPHSQSFHHTSSYS